MDKRERECWASMLGRSLKRGKGRGVGIFTANIPFSTRHPVEKMQSILVINLAVLLFLLPGILFPEEGATQECEGRWGVGGREGQERLSWSAPLVNFRLDYSLVTLTFLFITLFWFPFCVWYSWASLALHFFLLVS